MKNQTVTAALRESIVKATGRIMQELVYSDSRRKGAAVGIKVCYAEYSQPIQDAIVEDMENKGYKLAYIRYNSQKYCVPGTRFCFYKK